MKRYHLEHDEQVAVMNWAGIAVRTFPALRWLYANGNGGMRHIGVARKMKAEGVKPGVPDLTLPVAMKGYHGLYIEMKQAGKRPVSPTAKGPLSDEQIEWIKGLRENGYYVEVCYGSFEAINLLEWYVK